MRVQVAAVAVGAAGALGGGFLVGVWCLGLVLIVLSGGLIAFGLLRDSEPGETAARRRVGRPVTSFEAVLDRARRAS